MSRNEDKDNSPQSGGPSGPDPRRPSNADDQPTFGSFVSNSVRRSAGRFRGERGPARSAPRRESRRSPEGSPSRTQRTRQFVPSRVHEEEIAPPSSATTPPSPQSSTELWIQDFVDRAGGPQRAIGAAVGVLVLVVVVLALLLSLLGGGDDGDAPEIPATGAPSESILFPPGFGTPSADGTPAGPEPTPTTSSGPDRGNLVTPTSGSDNVLDQNGPGTPPSGASNGPPTARCSDTCLVRIADGENAKEILAANGTRPSYTGDDWLWAIADPAAVAGISSQLDTEVIRQTSETLALYMVTVPQGVAEQGAVESFGTVLDSVDTRRLVEVESVPANVRVVIETGLTVEKVAPAPPSSLTRPEGRQPIEQAGVGSLSGLVDTGNIETAIQELQAVSSTDGSGVGTRYYTAAGNQIAADMLYRQLESYGLDVWYEDVVTPEGLLLVNVIGEIPGSDPSRIYGVLAHFDSISDSPTATAPGADDNASGVAATLEISRVLAGYDLRYSYRAVFVNAEEVGILGADEFARDAVEEGEPWEGVFNIDSIGSARNGDQIVLNATGESVWMEDLLARINDAYGIGQSLYILQSEEIVADDNMLREQGIESVLVARELYGWSPIHHTSNDLFQNVSIPHVASATELVLLSVASLLQ